MDLISTLSYNTPTRGRKTHLLRGNRIFRDAPPLPETIGELKDGEYEFALGCTALLQARLQSELLDSCRVGGGLGEVMHCGVLVWAAAPAVPAPC